MDPLKILALKLELINDILNIAFVPNRILAPLADALNGGVAPKALFGPTPEETGM